MYNVSLLHSEVTALGIPISGADSEGNVSLLLQRNKVISIDNQDGTFGSHTLDEASDEYIRANLLISMVINAHGKSLTSAECLTLQQELTELEWDAYCDARKAPIRQARAARYASECDALYLSLVETAFKANTTPDLTTWASLKDQIRLELPYPTED